MSIPTWNRTLGRVHRAVRRARRRQRLRPEAAGVGSRLRAGRVPRGVPGGPRRPHVRRRGVRASCAPSPSPACSPASPARPARGRRSPTACTPAWPRPRRRIPRRWRPCGTSRCCGSPSRRRRSGPMTSSGSPRSIGAKRRTSWGDLGWPRAGQRPRVRRADRVRQRAAGRRRRALVRRRGVLPQRTAPPPRRSAGQRGGRGRVGDPALDRRNRRGATHPLSESPGTGRGMPERAWRQDIPPPER